MIPTAGLRECNRISRIIAATPSGCRSELAVSATIENHSLFMRSAICGRVVLPDYVVLISTLGGIEPFDLHGFIMGPVIAATFLSVWAIFSTVSAPAQVPDAR